MKNLITYLKTLWRRVADSQRNDSRNDRRHDCRLTVGSPSGFNSKWMLKLVSVLVLILTIGIGNVWGATYTYTPSGSYTASGGTSTVSGIAWTYSSATYLGLNNSKIQIGSKNNPQTSAWTIQTAISNFGSGKKVTAISLTAYTTATTATYDISAGGSSVKSGSLTTSSNTYTASSLNVTSGNIVITMTGSANSKAMYLVGISVTYEDAGATYTYSFNNGGHGTAPSGGTAASVTLAAITATGYTCTGWKANVATKVGGSNVAANTLISNGSVVTLLQATTFTAQWSAKTTTVSFNQNSGTGGQTTSKTATYGSAMPTPITTPTREHYTFEGYYDGSGGTGTKYYNANGTSARTWDKDAATATLYAKWTPVSYTVTWKVNGTIVSTESVSYNSTATLPTAPNPASYCGDKFMGWTTVQNHDAATAPSPLITSAPTVTGDVTYYAVFGYYEE